MIVAATEVKSLDGYKIFIKYADNISGEIDLAYLKGIGVFKAWEDYNFFNSVRIDDETGAIIWGAEIDLCPNTLYLKIKGISFEKWNKENTTHATN